MSPGWQSIDMMVRCGRTALRSADMQKSPNVVAVIQSVTNTLSELLSHYVSGTGGGTSTPAMTTSDSGSQGDTASSDADSQPAAPDEGGGDE